jgi:hypothetical protein
MPVRPQRQPSPGRPPTTHLSLKHLSYLSSFSPFSLHHSQRKLVWQLSAADFTLPPRSNSDVVCHDISWSCTPSPPTCVLIYLNLTCITTFFNLSLIFTVPSSSHKEVASLMFSSQTGPTPAAQAPNIPNSALGKPGCTGSWLPQSSYGPIPLFP